VKTVSAPPAGHAARPLRILILGGTGFIGPHQVRAALARGHHVTLLNRGRHPSGWPAAVEARVGDRETGDLRSLATGEWDVCIDNSASVPSWVRDAGRVLAERVQHYIFISSISVLADHSQPGRDESAAVAEYPGPDAMAETRASLQANLALYGPLKARCEREAERHFPGRTTVIRPTLIAGPGDETDRFTYWPVRLARGGEVLAPPAADPVQIIDARDLADWTVRLAEGNVRGVFHAAGPAQPLTVEAMVRDIRAAMTGEMSVVFADAAFLAAQQVAMWSDLPAWVPGTGEMAGFARVSNARAVQAGLTFRPIATTAADTLAWFQAQPEARRSQLRAGLSAEREAAVLRAWLARPA